MKKNEKDLDEKSRETQTGEENTFEENASEENAPEENTSGENASEENTSGENTSGENTSRENTSRENSSRENSSEETASKESKRPKFVRNSKYYTISVYAVLVTAICAFVIRAIFLWTQTAEAIGGFFSILSPFIWGGLVAFVLNPVVNYFDKLIFRKLLGEKRIKTRQGLSLLLTYVIVIGMIVMLIAVVIPRMIESITMLVTQSQEWYATLIRWLRDMQEQNPDASYGSIADKIQDAWSKVWSTMSSSGTISDVVLPQVYNLISQLVSAIGSVFIVLVSSVYLIVDKERTKIIGRRIAYSILPEHICESFISTLGECAEVFSQYITGKTLDSIIIGILSCCIFTITRMPYALLIAIVVGITNMIPYFGPFIGAVPGFIIIVMINPIKALIYLVLILAIQQFDGLYLGPKIIGNSTGLRPFWVIFGVSVGGSVAGVVGMFLGVPVVGVFALLLDKVMNYRLKEKGKAELCTNPGAEMNGGTVMDYIRDRVTKKK